MARHAHHGKGRSGVNNPFAELPSAFLLRPFRLELSLAFARPELFDDRRAPSRIARLYQAGAAVRAAEG
jgi:hypothetical protein